MLYFWSGEARTSSHLPAARVVIIYTHRSPFQCATRQFSLEMSLCLHSIACFFSAESVMAGYALRHRTQQNSSQHKKCLGHRLAAARLATAQAFLHLPPYSCLSSPFSNCSSKGSCRSFPMFLQHIAGIHFTDVPVRFVPAVYTLPQPRTAVCRLTGNCIFI